MVYLDTYHSSQTYWRVDLMPRRSSPRMLAALFFLLMLFGLSFPSPGLAAEVALLLSSEAEVYQKAVKSFRVGLGNAADVTEYQMQGDLAEGRIFGEQIRASTPDVVVAVGVKAALAAKLEILDTPVIFCLVLYPSQYGLPTSNMYGIPMQVSPKRQLLSFKDLLTGALKVGVMFSPEHSGAFVQRAQEAAKNLSLSLTAVQISKEADVPKSLRTLLPQIDVLWLVRDPTVVNADSLPFLLETALDQDVPILGFSPKLVQHGALASLSYSYEDMGMETAQLAKTLLQKTQPLPSPSHMVSLAQPHLDLNIQTAQLLGVSIPPSVVKLANNIFGGTPQIVVRDSPSDTQNALPTLDDALFVIQ